MAATGTDELEDITARDIALSAPAWMVDEPRQRHQDALARANIAPALSGFVRLVWTRSLGNASIGVASILFVVGEGGVSPRNLARPRNR
jgi:hypothetical protein